MTALDPLTALIAILGRTSLILAAVHCIRGVRMLAWRNERVSLRASMKVSHFARRRDSLRPHNALPLATVGSRGYFALVRPSFLISTITR